MVKMKKFNTFIPDKKRKVFFGNDKEKLHNYNSYFKSNEIRTTKYNAFTWFPKSLLFQFTRAANIYFLIISVLTLLPFSPKKFLNIGATFAFVLIFTMVKEAYEDIKRYKADKLINNKTTSIYDYDLNKFKEVKWKDVKIGNIIKIRNNQEIPCDILLLKASSFNGIAFLDTKNLDGETNLKPKLSFKEFLNIKEDSVLSLKAKILCDESDDNLNSWHGVIEILESDLNIINQINTKIDNLLLKGCFLKNTEYIIGVAIYTGHSTKIMKNSKRPKSKVSNIMKIMNRLLYSLFIFMAVICILFASLFFVFQLNLGQSLTYFYKYNNDDKGSLGPVELNIKLWIIKFLTFLIAYSHLIPISLYVGLEVLKIVQVLLVTFDGKMWDSNSETNASPKTSDLIEELGQVEFIFTDKTGTLTKNEMIFKKCSINNILYGEKCTQDDTTVILDNTIVNSYLLNDDFRVFERLSNKEHLEHLNINYFFTICAVCHSAYLETKDDKKIIQSSSPDEVALIEAAEKVGFNFINKTPSTIEIEIKWSKEKQIWNVLLELPFDSTRKRMSLVVNKEGTNEYLLLTKGADSEMLKKMNLNEHYTKTVNNHLNKFAEESYRTLVLGKRSLSIELVNKYIEINNDHERLPSGTLEETKLKLKKQIELYEEIESNLEYIGCTAIEDKLQDNVDSTIESLLNANIKIWVLTGDKKETAIEIAKSCKLINSKMTCIDLANTLDDHYESLNHLVNKIDEYFYWYYSKAEDIEIDKNNQYTTLNLLPDKEESDLFLIVDGKNLSHILNDIKLRKKFFRIAILTKSVICCRVSPAQKAEVVRLTEENGKWITLSIGDGANDVPMIMTANIGIGVQGKEGTQAVRSADYSIGQFQFLKILLFTHGRWGYRRVSFFIYYYFYKNIILVFVEIYFAMFNGFSGSLFYPDFLPSIYNAFGTSAPAMFSYAFERDVDDELSLKLPILYRCGQVKYYFNMKTFWKWIAQCLIHGILVYFGGILSLEASLGSDGLTQDHWLKSIICFSIIMHIATYKIFIELKNWTKLNM